MLPALPVDKITASAREAAMAGAAKEEGGSSGGRSRRARGSVKKPGGRAAKGEQIAEAAVEAAVEEETPIENAETPESTGGVSTGTTRTTGSAVEPAVLPPVREGEDDWTIEELDDVRSRLVDEVNELGADIASAESQIAQGDSADGAGDDQADLGTKTYTREHEMSLALNAREILVQNERAIHRIDAGTYGMCESCGNPIGKARLQAFPRATLCVRCKQREERR